MTAGACCGTVAGAAGGGRGRLGRCRRRGGLGLRWLVVSVVLVAEGVRERGKRVTRVGDEAALGVDTLDDLGQFAHRLDVGVGHVRDVHLRVPRRRVTRLGADGGQVVRRHASEDVVAVAVGRDLEGQVHLHRVLSSLRALRRTVARHGCTWRDHSGYPAGIGGGGRMELNDVPNPLSPEGMAAYRAAREALARALNPRAGERVCIGTPHLTEAGWNYVESLWRMGAYDKAHGNHLLHNSGLMNNGSFAPVWGRSMELSHARNTAAAAFLSSESDWLLWIDSDIGFQQDALAKRLSGAAPAP